MHPLVNDALAFAARAHQYQFRKGADTPYIVHPVGVMLVLLEMDESDPEVLAAALLHDTVEDTGVPLEELRSVFGARVAGIVEGCSEPDKSESWEARKQHTVAFLRGADRDTCLVAAADKLHNLRCLQADHALQGEALWGRFKRGRVESAWYYRSVTDSLLAGPLNGHRLTRTLDQLVRQFFGAV